MSVTFVVPVYCQIAAALISEHLISEETCPQPLQGKAVVIVGRLAIDTTAIGGLGAHTVFIEYLHIFIVYPKCQFVR